MSHSFKSIYAQLEHEKLDSLINLVNDTKDIRFIKEKGGPSVSVKDLGSGVKINFIRGYL